MDVLCNEKVILVGPVRIACEPERAMLPCPIREVVDEVKRIGELVT